MRGWKFLILACVLLMPCVAMGSTVLVDFYADWCGPCQSMSATVQSLQAEGYAVQRINIDENRELANYYGVQSIPCFVVIENKREVDRIVGVTSRERLTQHLWAPAVKIDVKGRPHEAWRFEHPVGHYAAVVRIECKLQGNQGCLGSGVVVRWGGKIVVLTARHVVKDATRIVVRLSTGKKIPARVLTTSEWDCAVLQLDEVPVGIAIAELEFGQAAMFHDGDKLTSCGYGGQETKLAANTGGFVGYRRNATGGDGHDDWFEMRGPARQGDSGGPIFNERGRVVGILWGTDGQTVIGVQAGRIHVAIQEGVKHYRQQADWEGNPLHLVPVVIPTQCGPNGCGGQPCAPAVRNPTPPMYYDGGSVEQADSMLPWRKGIEGKVSGIERTEAENGRKLDAILGQLQQGPSNAAPPVAQAPPVVEMPKENPGNALEQKLDAFLHKLPIQGPLAKLEEKQLESKPALERFFGATAAIVFLTLIGTVVVGAVVILGHKIYQKCHADLPAIQAKLATIPGIGAGLAAGIGTLDAANTTVDAKLQAGLADIKTHMTGLLTPAPGQGTSTPPVSVNVTPSK